MLRIGLTGGIATGKSKAAEILKGLGVPVISADDLSHHLTQPHLPAWQKLKEQLPENFFDRDGKLNRKKLGSYAFTHPETLKKLEEIIHPYVTMEIIRQIGEYEKKGCEAVVVENPLLYETRSEKFFHLTIVVYLQENLQLERLMRRDKLTKEAALARIEAQMPMNLKVEKADFIIDNSKDISYMKKEVERIWSEISEKKQTFESRRIIPKT